MFYHFNLITPTIVVATIFFLGWILFVTGIGNFQISLSETESKVCIKEIRLFHFLIMADLALFFTVLALFTDFLYIINMLNGGTLPNLAGYF